MLLQVGNSRQHEVRVLLEAANALVAVHTEAFPNQPRRVVVVNVQALGAATDGTTTLHQDVGQLFGCQPVLVAHSSQVLLLQVLSTTHESRLRGRGTAHMQA